MAWYWWVVIILVIVLAVTPLLAQRTRRDRVVLTNNERVPGKVLKESWKGVELDRDMDGTADVTYRLDEVKEVIYGNLPQYLLDAMLLRSKPEKNDAYIATLRRAYFDRSTSKWILQHAYYNLAKRYEKLAARNEEYLLKAQEAYLKLLHDIPETRYALQLRMDLGEMFLYRGQMSKSREMFSALLGKGFGAEVEAKARFRQAQSYLIEGKPDKAAEVLDEVKPDELDGLTRAKLAVLRADVLLSLIHI